MKLSTFPRPKGDNGRGIHWSPSTVHPADVELTPWIEELLRMNIKWVKVLDDGRGSSLELCQHLVQNDMMPIVRLCREPPNPGPLGRRQAEAIRKLVDVGVRYFESNSDPDRPTEWNKGQLPRDWPRIVVSQFISDADMILGLGGLPGVPALSIVNKVDLVALVAREGRADLFEQGTWIAVHNYTFNHPPEYPDDDVNQQGTQLKRRDYEAMGAWAWDEEPRPLVNLWRRQDKHCGYTIKEDPECWRSFELADSMARATLGHSVPVLGTEGGAVIGWRDDRRYPRVTPELHQEWTVHINQFMQEGAPDYFFTTCHWLLANFRLGHRVVDWESQAWFSDWWKDRFGISDHLPAVEAVRAMPSVERVICEPESEIKGMAVAPSGRGVYGVPVTLWSRGQALATVQTNARGRFRFGDLPAGDYKITAEGWSNDGTELHVAPRATADVKLPLSSGHCSVVRGRLCDPAGRPIAGAEVKLHSGQQEDQGPAQGRERSAHTDQDGAFIFPALSEGHYELSSGTVRIPGIEVDGWGSWEGDLIQPPPPEPCFVVASCRLLDREENAGRHLFFGYVLAEDGTPLPGILLEMNWADAPPGISFPQTTSGHDSDKPAGYFEFVNTPGEFHIRVVDDGARSEVAGPLNTADLPGREDEPLSYEIIFQRKLQPPSGGTSELDVVLPGCLEQTSITLCNKSMGTEWTPTRCQGKRYHFEGLPAGRYTLQAGDIENLGELELDGFNPATWHIPMHSSVKVRLSRRARPGQLQLSCVERGISRELPMRPGIWRTFAGLPAGEYHLRYLEWHSDPIHLDGTHGVSIENVDGRIPYDSMIEGRLTNADGEGLEGRQIVLMLGDERRAAQLTDRSGRFCFAGLGKGIYSLQVKAVTLVRKGIVLDGYDSKVVDLVASQERPGMFDHYILLPVESTPGPWVALALLQEYVRHFKPAVGFDAREAAMAKRVTIVGDKMAIGQEIEDMLLDEGCLVQRLPGDSYQLHQALQRMLRTSRA